jgi:signal transduction histidine kinase
MREMLAAPDGEFDPTIPGLFAGEPPAQFVPLLEEIAGAVRPETLKTQLPLMAEADQRDLLPHIAAPVLLIWGDQDARSPLSVARQFEQAIPDAKLVVIRGAAALPAIGQRAARRGGFRLRCDLRYDGPHSQERLLVSVARELLANAAAHAGAAEVSLRLLHEKGEVVLVVTDDGGGFDMSELPARLAHGHIGLASHRMRVESVGGRLDIDSFPGQGTSVVVRLPDDGA